MPNRFRTLAAILTMALILTALESSPFRCGYAIAQDQDVLVVRAPNDDDKYARLVGSVIELTSEHAIFVAKGSTREQKIVLSRLAELEPVRSDDDKQGRLRLAAGEFESAKESFEKALATEKIAWRQKELTALISQCEMGLGGIDAAGKRMAPIMKGDPDSRLLGYLPLAWIDGFKTPSQASLSAWASDPAPAMKLTAASWMLGGEKRKDAIALLEKLAQGASRRIASLAESQLWRIKLSTATALETQRWLDRAAGFPEDLRAGPYFVAAQAAARNNLHTKAAEAWMQVALMHPLQASLATEAQFLAARQLQRGGVNGDAIALFERIAAKPESHPHRTEAIEALTQLRGAAK